MEQFKKDNGIEGVMWVPKFLMCNPSNSNRSDDVLKHGIGIGIVFVCLLSVGFKKAMNHPLCLGLTKRPLYVLIAFTLAFALLLSACTTMNVNDNHPYGITQPSPAQIPEAHQAPSAQPSTEIPPESTVEPSVTPSVVTLEPTAQPPTTSPEPTTAPINEISTPTPDESTQTIPPATSSAPTQTPAPHISVANISGVPTTASAGSPLILTGTVSPSNATNKTITWSIESSGYEDLWWTFENAGRLDAQIDGNSIKTGYGGIVTVRATIIDGIAVGTNYTQDFNISFALPEWEYTVNRDNTVTITRYNGRDNRVVIPSTIEGRSVTAIEGINEVSVFGGLGKHYYEYNSDITSITIPNSVTRIGSIAFDNCPSLANITIPDSVTYIGNSAFQASRKLTNIVIPRSVTHIGDFAFAGLVNLSSITVHHGVTSIGQFAFADTGITTITIPNTVTYIGEYAFHTRVVESRFYGDGITVFVWQDSYAHDFCLRYGYRFEFVE
jgi:hypothetical protein